MSGAVAMTLGGAGPRVNIADGGVVQDVRLGPDTALARIDFESDGDITSVVSTGSADAGDWIAPKGAAPGSYEIMAHQNSGTPVTGTLDTWQALSSSRSWSVEQLVVGSATANLTISIRLNGGSTLSSGTFTLEATVG